MQRRKDLRNLLAEWQNTPKIGFGLFEDTTSIEAMAKFAQGRQKKS